MHGVAKILVWLAIIAVITLAILLPVVIVSGFFGGRPFAGSIALVGMILLAFGVAWYVYNHGEMP